VRWGERLLECFGPDGEVASLVSQGSPLAAEARLNMTAHYLGLLPQLVERHQLLVHDGVWKATAVLAEESISIQPSALRIRAHIDHALEGILALRRNR